MASKNFKNRYRVVVHILINSAHVCYISHYYIQNSFLIFFAILALHPTLIKKDIRIKINL